MRTGSPATTGAWQSVRATSASGCIDVETSERAALTTETATLGVGSVAMGALADAPEPVRRGVLALAWPERSLPRTLPWLASPGWLARHTSTMVGASSCGTSPAGSGSPCSITLLRRAPQTSEIYLTLALHPRGPCTRRFEPPVEPGFPALSSTACLRGPPKTVDSGSSPSAGHARTVAERWTWLFGPENAQADSFAVLACACPSSGRRSSPRYYRDLALRPQARRGLIDPPDWWNGLARAVDERPDANVTVLARMLKRRRWEIQVGAEALQMVIANAGEVSERWTAERLREEYVVKGRRLTDLADELGVSVGTLTKTLRKHHLYR